MKTINLITLVPETILWIAVIPLLTAFTLFIFWTFKKELKKHTFPKFLQILKRFGILLFIYTYVISSIILGEKYFLESFLFGMAILFSLVPVFINYELYLGTKKDKSRYLAFALILFLFATMLWKIFYIDPGLQHLTQRLQITYSIFGNLVILAIFLMKSKSSRKKQNKPIRKINFKGIQIPLNFVIAFFLGFFLGIFLFLNSYLGITSIFNSIVMPFGIFVVYAFSSIFYGKEDIKILSKRLIESIFLLGGFIMCAVFLFLLCLGIAVIIIIYFILLDLKVYGLDDLFSSWAIISVGISLVFRFFSKKHLVEKEKNRLIQIERNWLWTGLILFCLYMVPTLISFFR